MHKHLPRRQFLRDATALSTVVLGGSLGLVACGSDDGDEAGARIDFLHGVASGDPLNDRVILWTRVSPRQPEAAATLQTEVGWELATDASFSQVLAAGSQRTSADQDHTVKVDAGGLQPGNTYYYRFKVGSKLSPVGRTKTLPTGAVQQVKLAVFSCANYPAGYFNVYAEAARRNDLDAALHLGDYLYEYPAGGYASEGAAQLGRVSDPAGEILSLSDYRRRHAQYRSDPDLQALHAALPMIVVWDDHEIANDTWRNGAENHDPATEGSFAARRAAAIQAYLEWLPLRLPDPAQPDRIYRSFQFGQLLSLHMLDTRQVGRDEQLSLNQYLAGAAADPARQLLGSSQETWLNGQLQASTATWQVLGQQVLMARMLIPASVAQAPNLATVSAFLTAQATPAAARTPTQQALVAQPRIPYNLDAWDGYPAARERLLAAARTRDKNLVVLAGDTHNAWASNLTDGEGRQVGVEFACASVSSPGMEVYLPEVPPAQLSQAFPALVTDLEYADTSRRGLLLLTVTPTEVRGEHLFVSSISSRSYTTSTAGAYTVLPGAGQRRLVAAG